MRYSKKSTHRDIGKLPFGVCSVWHKPAFAAKTLPHIICPERLAIREVIQRAEAVLPPAGERLLLQRVRIAKLGTMDYVAVRFDKRTDSILDFCGIEVMAMSTTNTGKIIHAMKDALNGRLRSDYGFGINYRQVLSRMLVQLCAKGEAFSTWGKRSIWVIQDILYEYMEHKYDLRLPKGSKQADPILLMIYSLVEDGDKLVLRFKEQRSGHPRHFSGLLFTMDIPTRRGAEEILLKRINCPK